jgi:hypothetical protein
MYHYFGALLIGLLGLAVASLIGGHINEMLTIVGSITVINVNLAKKCQNP